jgi:hypothetical protein
LVLNFTAFSCLEKSRRCARPVTSATSRHERSLFEGQPRPGTWFDGWVQDLRRTPLTTSDVPDYCPEHARLTIV